ncbi:MarR family transcriptional regulator [Candidatus Bipolaricaulota bacterium]|nr:MarR family transcriptional regulator [Candidatus Bipolaricaulota bacterium]
MSEQMRIGQLLLQVCRLTGDRLRVKMEEIGVHRAQGLVLLQLCHRDGISQRQIIQARHVSPATMTNMLQRMERDGWITRERDSNDQRMVRVYLTEKAKSLRKEAQQTFRGMEEELASVYTDEEKEMFCRLLMKLHERFAPLKSRHCHDLPFLLDAEGEDRT